jgi:hypothetical protein
MKLFFQIFGTVICLLFAYATYTGWTVTDVFTSSHWGPAGQKSYHK